MSENERCKYRMECKGYSRKRKQCSNLKIRTQECPVWNEKETGINYGCLPCLLLAHWKCKGEKPGAFYYPTECPEFYSEEIERDD